MPEQNTEYIDCILKEARMKIDIDKLSEAELVELNHRIVERLRFLESLHNHREMLQFSIGEKVSFEAPGRGRQIGTLVRYNKKSVTVVTDHGQKWTVSPHLLSRVKDTQPTASKVVELRSKQE
jgi:hypothetical protein